MTFMSIRSVGLALLMAFAAAGALRRRQDPDGHEKVDLPASATAAWATIKDFNGWQDLASGYREHRNHQREREHQRYGAGHEHQGWRANYRGADVLQPRRDEIFRTAIIESPLPVTELSLDALR